MKQVKLLVFTLLLALCHQAQAETVNYLEVTWNGESKMLDITNKEVDATPIPDPVDEWIGLGNGWYIVNRNVTCKTVNILGNDVHLILGNNTTLTCTGGIKLEQKKKLTIYSQAVDDDPSRGKIVATQSYELTAAIGSAAGTTMGTLVVKGGDISATGTKRAAGIGTGARTGQVNQAFDSRTGQMEVYGGTIKAVGGECAAGIGGGSGFNNEGVMGLRYYQYGGTVEATGGEWGAGIGGGGGWAAIFANYTQEGGTIGAVEIYGGKVTAQGGYRAAGIGGGNNAMNKYHPQYFDNDEQVYLELNYMLVEGGDVNATGGGYGAGIGGGRNGQGVHLTIKGGDIEANGGTDAAGIGGGEDGNCNDILMTGGTVTATGSGGGAGMGTGANGTQAASISIQGGTLTAIAGSNCDAEEADGGSAIGLGKGENKSEYAKKVKITFDSINDSKYVKVQGARGNAEIGSEGTTAKATRSDVCQWRNKAKVEACNHDEEKDYEQKDDNQHIAKCHYCSFSASEDHSWKTVKKVLADSQSYQASFCESCGLEKQETVEEPDWSNTVSIKYWAEENKSTTQNFSYNTGDEYTLPDKPIEGMKLVGWLQASELDDVTCLATDADASSLKVPGTKVEVKDNPNDNQYVARYCYVYDATWDWAGDMTTATLTLTKRINGETVTISSDNVKINSPSEGSYQATATYVDEYTVGTNTYKYTYTFTDKKKLTENTVELYDTPSEGTWNDTKLVEYNKHFIWHVKLNGRTLYKDGYWNTLCLPFSISDINLYPCLADADVRTLESSSFNNDTKTLTMNFSKAPLTSIQAGRPYIVRWTTTGDKITSPEFPFVTIDYEWNDAETEYVNFSGCFDPITLSADMRNVLYLGANNLLYYADKEEVTIGAFRGVFVLDYDMAESGYHVRKTVMNFGSDESVTTAIAQPVASAPYADDHWYTLDGRTLSGKPTQKGLYIHKGAKVAIK